ncbi:hypothetical protein FOG48_04002 [Hanseniaspora uvarum]|nr:hypothetical protein FOG48_04002 [Hanseniaspora uvarum]
MTVSSKRKGESKSLKEKPKFKYTLNRHFSDTVNELKSLRNDIIINDEDLRKAELNNNISNTKIKSSLVKMDKLEEVSMKFQDKMTTGKKAARTGLGAKSEFFKEEAATFNKIVKDFNNEMTQFSHGTINEQYQPTLLLNDMVKFMANFNENKVNQNETTNKLSIREDLKVEESSMLMRFGAFYRSWTKKPTMNLHISQISNLSLKTKKRVEAKQQRQQVSKTVTRAKEISKEDLANTEEETSHRIQQISRILSKNKGEPFNLYRICIDPKSYSKTVENLFHVSFLVKSGFMRLFEKDGWPYLVLLEDEEKNDLKKSKKPLTHVTVSMSIDTYHKLTNYLNIDKPFLID